MEVQRFKEVENLLRKWLTEEGHPILETASIQPPATFAFAIAFHPNPAQPMKIPILVVGRAESGRIELIMDAKLSDGHRKAMNNPNVFAKSGISQLRERLLLSGVGFGLNRDGFDRIASLRLDDILYPDDPSGRINRDEFMRSLRRLFNVFLMVGETLSRVEKPIVEV